MQHSKLTMKFNNNLILGDNDIFLPIHIVVISENGRVKFFVKHEFSVCFILFINKIFIKTN